METGDRRAIDRFLAFAHDRLSRGEVLKAIEVRPVEPEAGTGDRRILSLVEMAIPRSRPGGEERDLLSLIIRSSDPDGTATTKFNATLDVLLPEVLRNYRRETATTAYVNNLVLTGETHEAEVISALTYAVRRDQPTNRLIADVQGFVEVLKQTTDMQRILSIAQAILDRIEVLEDSGCGEIVLAATQPGFGCAEFPADPARYLAFIGADMAMAPGHWWVRGSSLQLGASAETAVPATGSGYLLLRCGPRPTQQDVRLFFEDLRRRNMMKREELQSGGRGEVYESYIENQIESERKVVIDALYGDHRMLPAVTPVAIEFAADLKTVVTFGTDPETPFQRCIDARLAMIKASYGVSVPRPRLRANDTDMPPGSYLLMLNEVPIVMGTISLEKHFCGATVAQLKAGGITAEPATSPADGTEGAWIAADDAEAAKAHRFSTWSPAEYIAMHLDVLLRKNLPLFLGTHDIATELKAADSQYLLDQLHSAPGRVARFRTVLLALLCEELPVVPLPLLARGYLELADRPAWLIAEDLRLLENVNEYLVKDVADWRVYSLANDIADLVGRHIVREGDAALIMLETFEELHPVMSAVRSAIGSISDGGVSVILVEDYQIRPFVRKLVELEFPKLRVVARREVERCDPGELRPIEEISLE